MDTSDLINTGIYVVRPCTTHERRTAVVLGSYRGGTSMVAGVLHHLGVYMGDALGVTYEDRAFATAFENGDIHLLRKLRDERDQVSRVWGFKRPSAVKHLDLLNRELTNPYYLMIFRDVFAIANRRQISLPGRSDLVGTMRSALGQYKIMVDMVGRTEQPCLLLSYEKCLYRPTETVEAIIDFLGLDSADIDSATAFIQRDPDDYIQRSHRPTPKNSAAEPMPQRFGSTARSNSMGSGADSWLRPWLAGALKRGRRVARRVGILIRQ